MFTCALKNHNFLLVSFMSLGLVLECALQQEEIDASMLRQMIDASKRQCLLMNEWMDQQQEKGEE